MNGKTQSRVHNARGCNKVQQTSICLFIAVYLWLRISTCKSYGKQCAGWHSTTNKSSDVVKCLLGKSRSRGGGAGAGGGGGAGAGGEAAGGAGGEE